MWSSRVNLALVLIAVFAADPAFAAELNPDAINSAEPSKIALQGQGNARRRPAAGPPRQGALLAG
jgi:hypothetical protein